MVKVKKVDAATGAPAGGDGEEMSMDKLPEGLKRALEAHMKKKQEGQENSPEAQKLKELWKTGAKPPGAVTDCKGGICKTIACEGAVCMQRVDREKNPDGTPVKLEGAEKQLTRNSAEEAERQKNLPPPEPSFAPKDSKKAQKEKKVEATK